jgi:hypothetical protein
MLRTAPIRAYIPASNVPRASEFYEEIVGLTRWFKDTEGNILAVSQRL